MLYTLYNIQLYMQYTIIHASLIIDYSVRKDYDHSINLLVELRLQRSSSCVEFCKLTQVLDDFLFEVIFRVDISITDQFFCRISYFYIFLSKKFVKLVFEYLY